MGSYHLTTSSNQNYSTHHEIFHRFCSSNHHRCYCCPSNCCCSSNHHRCYCYPSHCFCPCNRRCSCYCCCPSYCCCSSSRSWIWCRLWCCSLVDSIKLSTISIKNTKAKNQENHNYKFELD